ncbi:MAG: hypothetical protein HYR75_05785 [Gemmatimonadetes bacterium]|nr:hypothetical protein [Gemmatimonadota bacterium]MBI3569187.1 hypothetical protein [Gemmatimonadota bacterium]
MASYDEVSQPYIATIESDGRKYSVSVRVGYDGVEYVGRLWFADEAWDDLGLPDRGALPGRTKEEVIAQARQFTPEELIKRHRRALSEKRRFHGLRKATDDILAKIRYLNQVAISMRAGLLDVEGAAQEIDLTEKQLHALIGRLSNFAGVED